MSILETHKNLWVKEQQWYSWASEWCQVPLHNYGISVSTIFWLEEHAGARYSDWMLPTGKLLLIRDVSCATQFILEGRDHD